MVAETSTDTTGPYEWLIADEVTHLREWGTPNSYKLPPTRAPATIGAADGCWIRLWDPTGYLSRKHAELTYNELAGWTLSDLRSKNGVHRDGARVSSTILAPGTQIRVGGVTLVAESPMFCDLRRLLGRFMGWADEHREAVDQALYSIRVAAIHREPLLICGPGNLISIARLLHRHILGDQPFVVCSRRSTYTRGMDAFADAAGGTLCVQRYEQPADFDEVVLASQQPTSRVLLMICAPAPPRGNDIAAQIVTVYRSIFIPPLADRASELLDIIDAYADDAIAAFGGWLAPEDRDWIVSHASETLTRIETATRRIIALHASGENITLAAKLLSMSRGSLSDWLTRRAFPERSLIAAGDENEE
jgi:hypothetical protein